MSHESLREGGERRERPKRIAQRVLRCEDGNRTNSNRLLSIKSCLIGWHAQSTVQYFGIYAQFQLRRSSPIIDHYGFLPPIAFTLPFAFVNHKGNTLGVSESNIFFGILKIMFLFKFIIFLLQGPVTNWLFVDAGMTLQISSLRLFLVEAYSMIFQCNLVNNGAKAFVNASQFPNKYQGNYSLDTSRRTWKDDNVYSLILEQFILHSLCNARSEWN